MINGRNPLDERRAAKAAARVEKAKAVTFSDAAERMIASHEAGWRNAKHRQQWRTTLAVYAYPIFGDLPVGAIDTGLVMKALEPIWGEKTETAARVRGRIEAVLDWSKARNYRAGENPARWRGHLDKLLPSRRKVKRIRNHPALPYAELPAFMADLRSRESVSARALEFAILTGCRTGEVVGAKWAEIDFKAKMWTIPAERMKGGREHRVPVADQAMAILEALPREKNNPFVFMGGRVGKPLGNTAMRDLMREMLPGSDYVPHGFRSTFRDFVAELTNYPRELAEAALAHTLGAVERAYQRGDLFEKRRRLMAEWAAYCSGPPARKVGGKVVAIRAGL